MENCYVLYSCDGSHEPIVSNYSGLSLYSGSYAAIYDTSSGQTQLGCFYILDLGEITCDVTLDIEVNGDIVCDCNTLCYLVKIGSEPFDTVYVNHYDEVVVANFETGTTVNFCSKVFPFFDITGDTPVQIVSQCLGNVCPPSLQTVKRTNECDVLTIFPMTVECLTEDPSTETSFDGAIQLYITGGTPPYTIFWEIGSYAPTLTNLGIGEYNAIVTDYYGDFTINTTCILSAQTPPYSAVCFEVRGDGLQGTQLITSQPSGIINTKPYYILQTGLVGLGFVFWDGSSGTWRHCLNFNCLPNQYFNYLDNNDGFYPVVSSPPYIWEQGLSSTFTILNSYLGPCIVPEPVIVYNGLCVFVLIRSNDPDTPFIQEQIQMNYNGMVNGKPSWISPDSIYSLYWSTYSPPYKWVFQGIITPSNTQIINNTPTAPPLSNWQTLGGNDIIQFTVLSGDCVNVDLVNFTVVVNEAQCGNSGTIMISPYGSNNLPYYFSIDGGQTFSTVPYFTGLGAGTYSLMVVDSLGISSQQTVNILSTPPTQYQLSFLVNYNANTFIAQAPTLPNGVSITFDLVHVSTFTYYPNNLSPIPQYNNIATIIGIGNMSFYNQITSFTYLTGPCTQITNPIIKNQILNVYTNTINLTSNQSISGYVSNNIIDAPIGNCENATGSYQLQITNLKINNCPCCEVKLI